MLTLLASAAQAQQRDLDSRQFDLKMQQYQSQRLQLATPPATRQRLEATALNRQQRLRTLGDQQRRMPGARTDDTRPRLDEPRKRRALGFSLDLERSQDPEPPPPQTPDIELLRDLDKR